MHAAAATAFLEHAAQAHDQGRWTASPRALRPLVAIALHRRCRPFFWRFYEHGEYHNPYYKLEVHAAAAAALGRGMRCAAPPTLPGASRPALRFSAAQACIQMGHLHALRQLVPALRHLVEHDEGSVLLVQAVSAREPAVVQLLLENGAQATMRAVQHALAGTPHPGILRALLGAARPAVLEMQSHFSYLCWTCPILYLLDASNRRQMASAACLERARLGGRRDWLPALTHPLRPCRADGHSTKPGVPPRCRRLHGAAGGGRLQAARLQEPAPQLGAPTGQLQPAGGCPRALPHPHHQQARLGPAEGTRLAACRGGVHMSQPSGPWAGTPAASHTAAPRARPCRWLWAAYERPAWAPATHSRFPPAFRAAVRALLLAAHRCAAQAGGHGGGATLGQLPPDLLLQIAGAAASPYSAWM